MLVHRPRRWISIKPTLGERLVSLVFAVSSPPICRVCPSWRTPCCGHGQYGGLSPSPASSRQDRSACPTWPATSPLLSQGILSPENTKNQRSGFPQKSGK